MFLVTVERAKSLGPSFSTRFGRFVNC